MAALTSARFVELYPEFAAVAEQNAPAVAAACAEATRQTDEQVFAAETEPAQAALAAHILASSPSGVQARLKATAGTGFETVYGARRKELERLCCSTWLA